MGDTDYSDVTPAADEQGWRAVCLDCEVTLVEMGSRHLARLVATNHRAIHGHETTLNETGTE